MRIDKTILTLKTWTKPCEKQHCKHGQNHVKTVKTFRVNENFSQSLLYLGISPKTTDCRGIFSRNFLRKILQPSCCFYKVTMVRSYDPNTSIRSKHIHTIQTHPYDPDTSIGSKHTHTIQKHSYDPDSSIRSKNIGGICLCFLQGHRFVD